MIDERTVQMRFDNQQFENGIQTSIRSLDSLEQSLKLKGATKGIEDLDAATRNFSLASLTDSVGAIANRFSVLGIMGVTALTNIANQAFHTGKQLLSAFTIDPVKTGFQEYETQINAVQTILANTKSKGTTIDDVNAALDELNTYADKTIYNFTQMTRNIGTFTAAGLDLKTSTSAIQGIANVAAVSGSTSQQASTAMYQLSQALSSGTVKLQDWNSVVNAGMGGQVFQDALKATARQMAVTAESVRKMGDAEKKAFQESRGYTDDQMDALQDYAFNVDELIEKNNGFRNSLSTGWITSGVLAETLSKFTVSGLNEYLSQTTGIALDEVNAMREAAVASGDADAAFKEMAKTLAASGKISEEDAFQLLDMATTAEDAATKVKTFTQLMDTLKEAAQSGWTQSWETVIGDFEEAKEFLTEISYIFGKIIDQSAQERNTVLLGWKDAGGRDELIQGFRNLLDALISIGSTAKEAYRAIFPGDRFLGMNTEMLVNLTKRITGFTEKLKPTEEVSEKLSRVFKGVVSIFSIGAQIVSALGGAFGKLFNLISPVGGTFLDLLATVGDYITAASDGAKKTETFKKAFDSIADALSKVYDFFGRLVERVRNSETIQNGFRNIGTAMNAAGDLFSRGASKISEWMDKLKNSRFAQVISEFNLVDGIAALFSNFGKAVSKAWSVLGPVLSQLGSLVGSAFSKLGEALGGNWLDILTRIVHEGLFAALSGGIIKMVNAFSGVGKSAGGMLDGLKSVFDGLGDTFKAWQQQINSKTLMNIAKAIGIMAVSLIGLALVNPERLGNAIASITIMFGELVAALGLINTLFNGKQTKALSGVMEAMNKLAVAMLLLSVSMVLLSTLDWDGVGKGLVAVAGGITILVAGTLALNKLGDKSQKSVKGMMSLALAMGVLALSVKLLGSMKMEQLNQGLTALIVMLTALGLFLTATDLGKMGISAGLGLMGLATGMVILTGAVAILGSMKQETLLQGLIGLASVLAMVAIAVNAMPKDLALIGAGLLLVGISLIPIAGALALLGSLDLGTMVQGLIAMAGALAIMAIAANAMTGAIAGAAAMLVMSVATIALAAALLLLSNLDWSSVGAGLVMLAGAFTIITVAGLALGALLPIIALGAASLAIFGAGAVVAGAGLLVLGIGMNVVIGAISSLFALITESIPAMAESFMSMSENSGGLVTSLLALGATTVVLVPLVPALAALGAGLMAFGAGAAVTAAGLALLTGAFTLLGKATFSVASSMSDIYEIFDLMGDMSLDAVKASSSTFKMAGKTAAGYLMEGFNETIGGSSGELDTYLSTMSNTVAGIAPEFEKIGGQISVSLTSSIGGNVVSGITNAKDQITNAFSSMLSTSLATVRSRAQTFESAGTSLVSAIINGMNSKAATVTSSSTELAKRYSSAVRGEYKNFQQSSEYLVKGLIKGLQDNVPPAVKAGVDLATAIKDAINGVWGVNSPATEGIRSAMFMDMGIAKGFVKYAGIAIDAAEQVATDTIRPIMTMADDVGTQFDLMDSAVQSNLDDASSLSSVVVKKEELTITHEFDPLTVKGVNDKGEFVATADYAVDQIITDIVRRQSRL